MNNLRDDEADRMIRANGEAEAVRLRQMEGEVADYRDSIDSLKKTVESLGDVKEFSHKENVRVYRNVQASLREELDKHSAQISEEMSLQNEALTRLVNAQRDETQQAFAKQREDLEEILKGSGSDAMGELKEKITQQTNSMDNFQYRLSNQKEDLDSIKEMISSRDYAELISSIKEEIGTTADRYSGELKNGLESLGNGNTEVSDRNTERVINEVSTNIGSLIPADLGKIKSSPIQVVTFLFTLLNTAAIVVLILMQFLHH
ncbi:MAG: hypothetical protein IJT00_05820 [Lachnospiraceae bacterium]|nr:hypothetical protein [Lachnospiraceae bacterium]